MFNTFKVACLDELIMQLGYTDHIIQLLVSPFWAFAVNYYDYPGQVSRSYHCVLSQDVKAALVSVVKRTNAFLNCVPLNNQKDHIEVGGVKFWNKYVLKILD